MPLGSKISAWLYCENTKNDVIYFLVLSVTAIVVAENESAPVIHDCNLCLNVHCGAISTIYIVSNSSKKQMNHDVQDTVPYIFLKFIQWHRLPN